ncbi:hypothetical protein EON66_11355, partial [archaeon]
MQERSAGQEGMDVVAPEACAAGTPAPVLELPNTTPAHAPGSSIPAATLVALRSGYAPPAGKDGTMEVESTGVHTPLVAATAGGTSTTRGRSRPPLRPVWQSSADVASDSEAVDAVAVTSRRGRQAVILAPAAISTPLLPLPRAVTINTHWRLVGSMRASDLEASMAGQPVRVARQRRFSDSDVLSTACVWEQLPTPVGSAFPTGLSQRARPSSPHRVRHGNAMRCRTT